MGKVHDVIVFKDNDINIEVRIDMNEETVWLSQRQMSELFNVSVENINIHINNLYNEGEQDKNSTIKESLIVQVEGRRKVKRNILLYNLDIIISVGYRVNSIRGVKFRKWANKIIKEYMLKGYSINESKLVESKLHYKDFTKSVKFISELYKRKNLDKIESNSLFSVINKYSLALDTLDKYDHRLLTINNTTEDLGLN